MGEIIDPQLLQHVLNLNSEEVIVPLRVRREDVSKIKAVKLSDQEVLRVQAFQDYLTDRGYLLDNTFASLFVYLFNLGYTLHKQIAEDEAKNEAQPA
jgi:hypothetical protein